MVDFSLGKKLNLLVLGAAPEEVARLRRAFRQDETSHEIFYELELDKADAAIRSLHPDLILIWDDPEGQGRDLCRRIRQRETRRHTGVIFIEAPGVDGEHLPVQCLEAGADDFIHHDISEREMRARVDAVLRLKKMTDELRVVNHRLEILSLTDDLTGLHNMRSFNNEYQEYLRRCRIGTRSMGVLMMDLDFFKGINDDANHLMGSHVICEVGKLIRFSGAMGAESCPARYGGDEYIIVFHLNERQQMFEGAEKLRRLIETAVFKKDGFEKTVTASIGVAWVNPGYQGKDEDPVKAADEMLYRAKELGRNQVCGMVLDPAGLPESKKAWHKEKLVTSSSKKGA